MLHRRSYISLSTVCFAALHWAGSAVAQEHFDVLVQSVEGKLTTGTATVEGGTSSGSLGARAFSRSFNSLFAIDNPGFNAIGTSFGSLPPSSDALPGNSELFWDFLPMKIGDAESNLLYWNGAGTTPAEVSFGPPPGANYSLSLFGENDARAAADGADRLIPGHTIDTTTSDGRIHTHRFFFLDNDHDDENATLAADGVYLISMRLRMAALDRSEPFYIAFATPGASLAALEAAHTWVEDRIDVLAPSFDADFDGDLDVDGADFLTWQRNLGAASALQISGDAECDRTIGSGDLAVWRNEFGSSLATLPGAQWPTSASVPEPAGVALALGAAAMYFANCRRACRTLAP